MTLVHIDLRTPDGTAVGVLEWVPTKRRTVAEHIVLPDDAQVALSDGVATIEVDATSADWAWRVVERVRRGVTRYVQVPDVAEVEYADLVDVDPATLDPVAEPEAAWDLALDAMGERVDDVETDVAGAQATADGAASAVSALDAAAVKTVNGVAPTAGDVTVALPLIVLDEGEDPPLLTPAWTLLARPTNPPGALFEVVEESATAFESSSSNDISLAVPADTEVDDTLVAVVSWQTDSDAVSAPAGWVLRQAPLAPSDYRSTSVYMLKVDSVPSSPQVFSLTGGGRAVGAMFRVTGADNDNPVLASSGACSRVGSVVTVPGTPGSAAGLALSVTNGQATSGQEPYPLTFENGWTPFITLSSSSDTGVTRTWLAIAWAPVPVDIAEHDISTPGAISSFASSDLVVRAAP